MKIMKRSRKIAILCTLAFFALVATALISGTASAKSLYVIADINAYLDIPIEAYDIQVAPTYLVYQTTHYIPDRDGGAVGLAIDSDSGYLFATFEVSGVIDLINGTTMSTEGLVPAPSASNLAGIVVDQDKQKVYTVDRNTNHLYVYFWDATTKTLTLDGTTYVSLPSCVGAYGLALDEVNDLLYVGDSTTSIKVYNTADWTLAGQHTVSHLARGIAIDVTNQLVYSGSGGPSGGTLLSKYDLSTSTETTLNVGYVVLGVAVDPATGLIYITTYDYDRLIVYNSSLTQKWISGDLGNPTGLCIPGTDVSYNPLNLGKDDGIGGCVSPGATFTYNITYDNIFNNFVVNNIVINDTLPSEVNFVSATDSGVYDAGTHTVEWDIGTLAAGAPQDSVEVTVQVNAPGGTVISNSVTIDSDETPPTTKTETTLVCVSTDTTPPVTVKTVGTPKSGPNDEWVTSDTEFNMTATDDDSGVNATYYRIWYNGVWSDWTIYTGNFTLSGDCTHYIEFYSDDNVGNEETVQNQTHYVDNTPPIPYPYPPEFGEPQTTTWYGGEPFVMINCSTPMWINITDPGCGIGAYRIKYDVWRNPNEPGEYTKIPGSDTTVYDGGSGDLDGQRDGNISVKLTFGEGCFHEVRWEVEDYFGFIGHYDYDFAVDCTPPQIDKYVGLPQVPGYGQYVSWVNPQTPFTFEATDDGCNGGAGVAKIGYEIRLKNFSQVPPGWDIIRVEVIDDDGNGDLWDNIYGEIKNITYMTEECIHEISFWAEDYVGNRIDHKQKHLVDTTPPEIYKTVGDPNCTGCDDCGENDYCVKTTTEISFYAEDRGCEGGVGLDEVKYRIWNESHGWGPWMYDYDFDGETITFGEECKHYLEIVATDKLGNTEIDNETFFVDDTPPEITKTVGDPNIQFFYWAINTEASWPGHSSSEQQNFPADWVRWTATNTYKDIYGSPLTSWDENDFSKQEFNVIMTREFIGDNVKWTVDYSGIEGHWSTGVQVIICNETEPLFNLGWAPGESTTDPIYKPYISGVGWGSATTDLPEGMSISGEYNETYYEIVVPKKYLGFYPDYWIRCDTPITIDAEDEGCCGNLTYVGYNINDAGWVTIPLNQLPKQIPYLPSCVHTLDIKAVDCLGNTKYDNETFYVDCDEPEIIKTVGNPNCTGCPDCELGDYCVKTNTEISFYAEDKGCMGGVGLEEVKYRIWGPEYGSDWIDAATLGVRDSYLSTTNDGYAQYDLDFTFDFYGNSYTQVYIGTNGYLTFDGGYTKWSHDGTLPSASNPLNMIAPAFYDICPNTGGDVYIYKDLASSPKKMVVEWNQCALWSTGGSHTLEVIIYETGEIVYQYGASSNNWGQDAWGRFPLVGIQNQDGTVGVQHDMPLFDGLALEFSSSGNSYVTKSAWGPWTYDYGFDGETFTFEEECKHYLEIVATDLLGNTVVDNETFFVDDTPPEIIKTVGDPNIPIVGDHAGDYWVSCATPITINANDLGCCNVLENVSYRINGGPWTIITNSLPRTFHFLGDCIHTLEIYAEDCLGNSETDIETFYVDCQPPIVEKEVGDPKCTQGLPEGDYYVTKDTRIWINATENYTFAECAVNEIHMLVGVWYDGVWQYTWYNETGCDGWIRVDFTFDELGVGDDCVHYVTYYVVDKLGNYVEDNETFYVDSTPPETVKSFDGPTYDDDYWLRDHDTWVILNTTDLEEPCVSGAKYLHVELWWASNGDDIDTLLWTRDIYDGDLQNDTDDDYGEIQYKFQIDEDCLHEIRWYSVDCLGNKEECSEQQVNLFFDDFEDNLDKWCYSRVSRKNNVHSHDGYYAELEAISNWRNAWMVTSVDTTGYEDITLSYWARTRSAERDERLRVKWRVGDSGDWTEVNAIQDNDWEYYTHDLDGAENQPVIQILFKMDCFWDYGLVDDVLVTGNTTMCTQQHRVDSTPPELIKTVGEPSFTDDNIIWWVTTDTEITLDAIDHEDPCAVGIDTLQYRIWWRGRWSEWMDYTDPFSFDEGCTHYLEVNVTDYLGNNVTDNETFIVHGSSGDDDPDVTIEYPTFLPMMTISDKTLEVKIHAIDEFTTWENLDVYLRLPGGRRDAPDLWYDVSLGSQEDYYVAYVDLYNYEDGAQLTLEAYAVDEDGNVGVAIPVTFTVHTTTIWDQWMQEGWNLLVLPPDIGCNESVERVMASADGSYDLVFHYDPIQGWVSYRVGAPANTLSLMEGGKSYWVHITNPDGIRYYIGLSEVEIQSPVNGQLFTEDPQGVNGIAWDSDGSVASVDIQLYYKNDTNVKHYWNGTDWVTSMTQLPCVLGGGYMQSWYYDTVGVVDWVDMETYTVIATATDSYGCPSYDNIEFSIDFTKYTLSGTIFKDSEVTLGAGDWLYILVFDSWPMTSPDDSIASEMITDPTIPYAYSFDLRNGTYYALALLVEAGALEGDPPYAAGAVYNISLENLMANGPNATTINGGDVSGRDMILYKLLPPPCNVEVTIDYPYHEAIAGDEALTINGTAYSPCSCVEVENVSLALYYTNQSDSYTYYWNVSSGQWEKPIAIYNGVNYISGGCGTPDPLNWSFTPATTFFHEGPPTYYIHVIASDNDGNIGEHTGWFTIIT